MKNQYKTVLIIGSNSFSGSHFIDLLLGRGTYEVHGVSRSKEKDPVFLPYKRHKKGNFSFHQIDLNRNFDALKNLLGKLKPQYVVHFAGLIEVTTSWKYPVEYFTTNTLATVRLCKYLSEKTYLKRYLHISTPEVYGSCDNIKENTIYNPSTPYAASKAAADMYLQQLVQRFSFPAVITRATNVYGAHQQLFRIIPRTIIEIKIGGRLPLHGGGKAVKSYIHIKDVCRGYLLAMEKGKAGDIYHFSPDKGVRVRELVELICQRLGASFEKVVNVVDERLGQDAAYIIDSSKARKELGWKPTITLTSGIDEVIRWIENHWDVIKKMPLEYKHTY